MDNEELAEIRRQEISEMNYWKAKAEGEHIAFLAVQEENDQLKEQIKQLTA